MCSQLVCGDSARVIKIIDQLHSCGSRSVNYHIQGWKEPELDEHWPDVLQPLCQIILFIAKPDVILQSLDYLEVPFAALCGVNINDIVIR